MKFAEFEKHQPSSPSNVYVFICQDELLVEESKPVWARIFGGEWDFGKLSAKEFEAVDASELAKWALSPPLFGPSKAIIVGDAGKISKKRLSAVAEIAGIKSSSLKLIFVVASRRSFTKGPKSIPTIEIDPLRPGDTVRWLRQRYGVSAEVARYLTDNLGSEL